MHSINLFSKGVLTSSILLISAVSHAHNAIDHSAHAQPAAPTPMSGMRPMDHSQMNHSQMDHQMHDAAMKHTEMHQAAAPQTAEHSSHDHRKEHGAQVYAVSTADQKWLVNEDGSGTLKSELETRIGTDENKIFIKLHADKAESHDAHYEAKILYSRMISDFWDAQIGARYRNETVDLDQHRTDTEEHTDAVIGLHGMAPYFFETEAYLYAGEDGYTGLSLDTERDVLLTQKLILKPYLDLNIVLSDDSKYAKKSGLSQASAGFETRYEVSKNIMPYIDAAYAYEKGNAETDWQSKSGSEQGWLYGAGIRFKF